jgi:PknH-like protein
VRRRPCTRAPRAGGQVATHLITVFDDRDQPSLVSAAPRVWGYCEQGAAFSTTSGDVVQHWVPGETSVEETRVGTTVQRQDQPPRGCHHGVAAQANVVVETIVCGDGNTADPANEIATRILGKLPG